MFWTHFSMKRMRRIIFSESIFSGNTGNELSRIIAVFVGKRTTVLVGNYAFALTNLMSYVTVDSES
jgi:hypothetical protein